MELTERDISEIDSRVTLALAKSEILIPTQDKTKDWQGENEPPDLSDYVREIDEVLAPFKKRIDPYLQELFKMLASKICPMMAHLKDEIKEWDSLPKRTLIIAVINWISTVLIKNVREATMDLAVLLLAMTTHYILIVGMRNFCKFSASSSN